VFGRGYVNPVCVDKKEIGGTAELPRLTSRGRDQGFSAGQPL